MKRLFALLCAVCLLAGCAFELPDVGALFGREAGPEPSGQAEPAAPEETPEPPPPEPLDDTPRDLITGAVRGEGEAMRPVAVMMRNDHLRAYPQWGIAGADALVEVISEGRVPSLMALYSHTGELPRVGPVGEGRDPLLQFALPGNAVVMQIGSNIYASNLLNLYAAQPLDGYYVGVTSFDFDRDRDAAGYRNEHCWYTKESLLQDGLARYEQSAAGGAEPLFAFVADGLPGEEAAPAERVEIQYSEECTIVLEYTEGRWRKYDGNWEPHTDADTGEALSFDKVVILQCAAGVKDDGYTRDYDLTQGTGVYLAGGRCVPMQWQKGAADQPLRLYDMQGAPLSVVPGRAYIAIYGGFAGQALRVLDAEGNEQTLPAVPAPLPAREPPPTPEPEPEPAPEEGGEGEPAPEEGGEGEPAPEG